MTTMSRPIPTPETAERTHAVAARWSISRAALAAAGRVREAQGDDPILEWSVHADAAVARLIDQGRPTELFRTDDRDRITLDLADGWVHAQVKRSGRTLVMIVTPISPADGTPVFARTALLAELGIAGGRYELERTSPSQGARP